MKETVAVFLPQGMILAHLVERKENSLLLENPTLVITRPDGIQLAPFLSLVQETQIEVDLKEAAFGTTFTPVKELADQFNSIFSTVFVPQRSGIELSV